MYVCYMKKMLFLSLLALIVISACKKDSLGTKPVISFKSYSSSPIIAKNGVNITFQLKDGDGDVQNVVNFAAIYDSNPTDTFYTARQMPDLEANNGTNLTADMILQMAPIDLAHTDETILKDSVTFLVYVLDQKSNSSDTVSTPKTEILYQ